jgi:hypothetical protein
VQPSSEQFSNRDVMREVGSDCHQYLHYTVYRLAVLLVSQHLRLGALFHLPWLDLPRCLVQAKESSWRDEAGA